MALLDNIWPQRDFSLPAFELTPLEFEKAGETSDELLLDAAVVSIGSGTGSGATSVVEPLPTAGELQARIERHLHRVQDCAPTVDAAAELRDALAELRRSLG